MKTFTLTSGNSRTFTLPAGTSWTVTEGALSENWATEITVDGEAVTTASGEIDDGGAHRAVFTNNYTAPGTLNVSKLVEGGQSGEYTFSITFNGVETETFTLNKLNRYTAVFEKTPGTTWTVVEETSALDPGWTVSVNGRPGNTASGVFESGVNSGVTFTNSAPGSLTVKKTAEGSDETFSFTLSYGGTTASFELADGASKNFTGLPAGTEYTVTENSGDGWRATVGGLETKTVSGTITAGAGTTLEFVNTPVEPRLTVAKTASAESLEAGETVDFTITVTNAGGDPLSDITLTDLFEGGAGDWYNTAVSTLVKLGIISGRSDTSFDPDAPITRAEFATLFARFDESGTEPDGGFSDLSGHWARESVERAAALGWIDGYEDGSFRPDNRITRAEAMTMVNRILNRNPV